MVEAEKQNKHTMVANGQYYYLHFRLAQNENYEDVATIDLVERPVGKSKQKRILTSKAFSVLSVDRYLHMSDGTQNLKNLNPWCDLLRN